MFEGIDPRSLRSASEIGNTGQNGRFGWTAHTTMEVLDGMPQIEDPSAGRQPLPDALQGCGQMVDLEVKKADQHQVDQPFRLAEFLLGQQGYDEERMRGMIGKGERTIADRIDPVARYERP